MSEQVEQHTFCIHTKTADQGKRLDAVVAAYLTEFSRSFIASFIRKGLVRVDGQVKKPGYNLRPGEYIRGTIPPPSQPTLEAENIPLNILYDDDHIIVVNKAAGMVVHPAAGNHAGTLVNALLHHCPGLKGIGGETRPGIVHRLDKDTSGIIVCAKDQQSHMHLSHQFKSRAVKKKYLALVHGNVTSDRGTIDAPIGRHPNDRKKMSVNSKSSRTAETVWQVQERYAGYTLLAVTIKTGRTHQIRVHLASIHHPVVGDSVYGGKFAKLNPAKKTGGPEKAFAARQMLHAWQLGLTHPISGDQMTFNAPLPGDIERLITFLRSRPA